jgi:hypothetical protein
LARQVETQRQSVAAPAAVREEAEKLQDDLSAFVHAAWPILEPVTPLKWNWHLDLICEYLTLIRDETFKDTLGRNCEGIIFNVPPRTMKSLLITVLFPVWLWTSRPARRLMFVSYTEKLSAQHSLLRRNVIHSAWYQERWGHVFKLARDQNEKNHYENSSRGQMFSTAMQATATGMGGDILIFDDPLNPDQALSEAERTSVNFRFDATFRSRVNDPASGVKIIVMQRLHELDLTGHVLKRDAKQWKHIKLSAIAECDEELESPNGGTPHCRKAGDLLWPERLSESHLGFCRPVPAESGAAGRRNDQA